MKSGSRGTGTDVLEGGEGGLTGTPLLPGSPYSPRRKGAAVIWISEGVEAGRAASRGAWLLGTDVVERGRGGGGVWNPRSCAPKMAQTNVSFRIRHFVLL